MKTFLGLPILLVLAATIFHTQGREAIGEVASIEQVDTIDDSSTIETANNDQVEIDDAVNEGQVGIDESAVSHEATAYEANSDETVVKEETANVEKVTTIEVISTQDGAAIVEEASTTHEAYVADCLYERPDCFCLDFQEPVCATNGCTYSSDCRRVCAEAEFAYQGPCHEEHLDAIDHLDQEDVE